MAAKRPARLRQSTPTIRGWSVSAAQAALRVRVLVPAIVLALAHPAALLLAAPASAPAVAPLAPLETYSGMAEASAAAMLDGRHFVVAEDECNVLRIYRSGEAAPVGPSVDLRKFLGAPEKASDIEGAARVGDTVYWISSHSLTKEGKLREWRYRFFGTRIAPAPEGGVPSLTALPAPYERLIADMMDAPVLKGLDLRDAAKKKPEEAGGLNIEGLAAGPDGSLFVGFRNPLRAGKAILVPVTNPADVLKGGTASFGSPVLLSLQGRGIRSIVKTDAGYWIVAGPVADAGTFSLYQWSGGADDAPRHAAALPSGFHAEAAIPLDAKHLLLLSDDGSTQPTADCGSAGKTSQRFRALRFVIP
jgi:hypothetical protein